MVNPEHNNPETRRILAEVRNDILEHQLNFPKAPIAAVVELEPVEEQS